MQLVKSLSALALLGAAIPSTYALSIKDDTFNVGVKLAIQTRAQFLNDADNATGANYDPLRGTNGEAESVRFSLRRVRFGLAAKYGDWRANFVIRGGEQTDRTDAANAAQTIQNVTVNGVVPPPATTVTVNSSTNGRPMQLYYANGARLFTTGEIVHDIHFGLDKPFNSESSISSSAMLFPTERIVAERIETRNVGIGYGLRSSFVNFGFDLMNNSSGTKDPQAGSNTGAEETNGYFYSARIEIMPGKEYNPGKRQESYVGKEGFRVVGGLDAQWDDTSLTLNNSITTFAVTDTFTWGPDLLVHWNYFTFLAEARFRSTDVETITDATGASTSTTVDGRFGNVQLAYAIPMESGYVVEPAVRYMIRDDNKAVDSSGVYGNNNDNGGEGTTIDLGVNLYFNGHANKLQLAYQMWEAEAGEGQANILRLQHQVSF